MEKNNEIWKAVVGFEGLYEVSNLGRVRGLDRVVMCKNSTHKTINGRILKTRISKVGYIRVTLLKYGKFHHMNLHRVIAQAFIPNPDNLPCINHKDENKQNNSIDNLEWCTVLYNNTYGTRLKRVGEKTRIRQSIPVEKLSVDDVVICTYPSLKVASAETGIWCDSIWRACQGKFAVAGGYKWRYAEESRRCKPAVFRKVQRTVLMVDANGNVLKSFPSLRKAGEETGICRMTISDMCKSGSMYNNVYWKYAE